MDVRKLATAGKSGERAVAQDLPNQMGLTLFDVTPWDCATRSLCLVSNRWLALKT